MDLSHQAWLTTSGQRQPNPPRALDVSTKQLRKPPLSTSNSSYLRFSTTDQKEVIISPIPIPIPIPGCPPATVSMAVRNNALLPPPKPLPLSAPLSPLPQLQKLRINRTETNNTNPTTGPSRCFPFWQNVLACYVVNTTAEDASGKNKCVPLLEDYYECLHHKKEVRSVFLFLLLLSTALRGGGEGGGGRGGSRRS